ncbi:antirestriction protein, partial [Escherichia coli]|nr:antirestriction protein [Escherichia coli]
MTDNILRFATAPVIVPNRITATLIADEQRISFWPQHFG